MIEKPIRINQTLIIFGKSHCGFHPPKHNFLWKTKTRLRILSSKKNSGGVRRLPYRCEISHRYSDATEPYGE